MKCQATDSQVLCPTFLIPVCFFMKCNIALFSIKSFREASKFMAFECQLQCSEFSSVFGPLYLYSSE